MPTNPKTAPNANPQGKEQSQDQIENTGNENREQRGQKHNEERHTGNKGNEDVAED